MNAVWRPKADECSGFEGPCSCSLGVDACPVPAGVSGLVCSPFAGEFSGDSADFYGGDLRVGFASDQVTVRPGGIVVVAGSVSLSGTIAVDLARVPYSRVAGLALNVLAYGFLSFYSSTAFPHISLQLPVPERTVRRGDHREPSSECASIS